MERTMPQPIVSLNGICKTFGALRAVDEVSFDVYPGEIFGLLGPNGAGKTTSIRTMLDIFRPDCGEVSVFGGPMTEDKKHRIGYMPEERGLYRDQKLEPTLHYLATLKGLSEKEATRRLESWLKRLDLWDARQKKIQDLSRGMQQKAQLIATLVHEPDLIVVDEPFANLDPVNTRMAIDMITEQAAAGKAVIMSTHLMYQVEAMCHRIVLINKGRVVLYGPVDQIKREFSTNAVLVYGKADFSAVPGVREVRQENNHWRLSLAPGATPQAILRALGAQDDARIERFELAEPSLDDIFISVVSGDHPEGAEGLAAAAAAEGAASSRAPAREAANG
jgi:ABC-2 type transport system ATP-binding protein